MGEAAQSEFLRKDAKRRYKPSMHTVSVCPHPFVFSPAFSVNHKWVTKQPMLVYNNLCKENSKKGIWVILLLSFNWKSSSCTYLYCPSFGWMVVCIFLPYYSHPCILWMHCFCIFVDFHNSCFMAAGAHLPHRQHTKWCCGLHFWGWSIMVYIKVGTRCKGMKVVLCTCFRRLGHSKTPVLWRQYESHMVHAIFSDLPFTYQELCRTYTSQYGMLLSLVSGRTGTAGVVLSGT